MAKRRFFLSFILIIFIILIVCAGTFFALYKVGVVNISEETINEFHTKRTNISALKENVGKLEKEAKRNWEFRRGEKEEINLHTLYYLNTRLALYKIEKGRLPDLIELMLYLDPIPREIFSGDNSIHLSKNNFGGWYYNRDDEKIEANIEVSK
jgi:hypothetical protein